jgi:hypothetical protein
VAFLPKTNRAWFGEVVKTHMLNSSKNNFRDPQAQTPLVEQHLNASKSLELSASIVYVS